MATKPKLLICELWGIGDLTLATTLIDKARAQYEVHLLASAYCWPETEILALSSTRRRFYLEAVSA